MKDQESFFRFTPRNLSRVVDDFSRRAERFLHSDESERSDEARKLVERYHSVLEKVMAPPLYIGTVIGPITGDERGNLLVVNCNNRLLIVIKPENESLLSGDSVMISSKTMQIIEKVNDLSPPGHISVVKEPVNSEMSEVDLNGDRRLVLNGKFTGKIHENDRVILDASNSIIIGWLGNSQKRFRLGSRPTITWDDIGGQKEAKEQLIETIEMPVVYAEHYDFYNKSRIKGVLLHGSPGCGKTMLLEAVATAIAKLHGQTALDSGFILIKGPEILDMYVGVAEGLIRQIFAMAKAHKKQTGYPALIAIDEADALLRRRGSGRSSDVETTIVPAFLTEMDGIDESGAIVALATNRIDIMDPAIVRDKRMDRHIKISRPDLEASKTIIGLNLKKVPLVGASLDEMIDYAATQFFSPNYKLYDIRRKSGELTVFTLGDLVNGAMLAGFIDKATSFAMKRDIRDKSKTGLTKDDVWRAAEQTFREKADLDHADEIREFISPFREDLSMDSIQKVRQAVKP